MHRVQRITKTGNFASNVGLKKHSTRWHKRWNSASCRWWNVKIKSAYSQLTVSKPIVSSETEVFYLAMLSATKIHYTGGTKMNYECGVWYE
jgi:hypothetical protein